MHRPRNPRFSVPPSTLSRHGLVVLMTTSCVADPTDPWADDASVLDEPPAAVELPWADAPSPRRSAGSLDADIGLTVSIEDGYVAVRWQADGFLENCANGLVYRSEDPRTLFDDDPGLPVANAWLALPGPIPSPPTESRVYLDGGCVFVDVDTPARTEGNVFYQVRLHHGFEEEHSVVAGIFSQSLLGEYAPVAFPLDRDPIGRPWTGGALAEDLASPPLSTVRLWGADTEQWTAWWPGLPGDAISWRVHHAVYADFQQATEYRMTGRVPPPDSSGPYIPPGRNAVTLPLAWPGSTTVSQLYLELIEDYGMPLENIGWSDHEGVKHYFPQELLDGTVERGGVIGLELSAPAPWPPGPPSEGAPPPIEFAWEVVATHVGGSSRATTWHPAGDRLIVAIDDETAAVDVDTGSITPLPDSLRADAISVRPDGLLLSVADDEFSVLASYFHTYDFTTAMADLFAIQNDISPLKAVTRSDGTSAVLAAEPELRVYPYHTYAVWYPAGPTGFSSEGFVPRGIDWSFDESGLFMAGTGDLGITDAQTVTTIPVGHGPELLTPLSQANDIEVGTDGTLYVAGTEGVVALRDDGLERGWLQDTGALERCSFADARQVLYCIRPFAGGFDVLAITPTEVPG